MNEIIRRTYRLLRDHERVTAAGVCHLLRDMDMPPLYEEASRALGFLVRKGYAQRHPDQGFGTEYSLIPR